MEIILTEQDLANLERTIKGAISYLTGHVHSTSTHTAEQFLNEALEVLTKHLPVRSEEAFKVLESMAANQSWTLRNREIILWAIKKARKACRKDGRWEELKRRIRREEPGFIHPEMIAGWIAKIEAEPSGFTWPE